MKIQSFLFFKIFFIAIFFIQSQALFSKNETRLDSLLLVLDKTIEQEKEYTEAKEKQIIRLKQKLKDRNVNPEEKLRTYDRLFKEYEAFVCDSALHYARVILTEAEKQKNEFWINESKLDLSRILATSGLFNESIDLLNSINRSTLTNEQLAGYYITNADTYIYWGEYTGGNDTDKYWNLRVTYLDSALTVLQPNTLDYINIKTKRFLDNGEYDAAERLLFSFLPKVEEDTREYAILTSLIAFLYEFRNDQILRKEYYARSATADIRGSIKENLSLRNLAVLILDDGDIQRANRYIKKSLEDANFYNARLRNLQVSRILPIIDKAYQMERELQQKKLKKSLIAISILSLLLVITIIFIIRQMSKLSKTKRKISIMNEELTQGNKSLAETNLIKEEYIGHFLNLYGHKNKRYKTKFIIN